MTLAPSHIRLKKRAVHLTWRARLLLYWERYAPIFAKAAALILIFMIGAIGGVWERIGDPWRLILLLLAIAVLIRSAWTSRNAPKPSLSDARRRVEHDNGVKHRPLDTLYDKPAISQAAWASHYDKALQEIDHLGPPLPRPVLSTLDPYKLRFILPAALILALMLGTDMSFERLRHSLTPSWLSGVKAGDAQFEAWVNPPEYTGRPPIYFRDKTSLNVPEGSEFVTRISGVQDPPRIKIITKHGRQFLRLKSIAPKQHESRTIVKHDMQAKWRIGQDTQIWTLTADADLPPTVMFNEPPKADKRDRLAFNYSAKDDYGIVKLELVLDLLLDDPKRQVPSKIILVPISANTRKADFTDAALDLTKHPWAGKKVSGYLRATDGLGQSAQSLASYFTVPDKIFIEPLAKAVIEQRSLVLEGNGDYGPEVRKTRQEWNNSPWFDTFEPEFRLDRAPAPVQRAALLMDAITDAPDGLYQDPAVYMGLKNVLYRLRYARTQAELGGIPEDLWSIALRAEFGLLGSALEEMREAERNLRDGMARRAPQREIDTLFERYNEAVDRYREELVRKAIEEGNMAENGGGGGQSVNMDEIQALLDAIEEANRNGDTESARLALAKLAELLENMQIQLAQGGGSGDGQQGEMSEEMQEALENLADLLGEQRNLQDETDEAERDNAQAGQDNAPQAGDNDAGDNDTPSADTLAQRQQTLSDMVGRLSQDLPENDDQAETGSGEPSDDSEGDAGQALDEARRAMQDSEQALQNEDLGASSEAQGRAIQALRRAGEALAEQARQQTNANGQNAQGDQNADPLGRNNGNGVADDNESTDLEQKDNATRSRELREELRRRASEQDRLKEERDYLRRLLERF